MKLNENTKVIGEKCILVPYEAKHVLKYHEWMKDPELLELTASEPLTLDKEYEMQASWRNDEDKCTFLILSKSKFEEINDEIASLIGDTNLFFQTDTENPSFKTAEAEIMIAEKSYHSQGYGLEAMLLMLKYGQEILKINKFIVKISETNLKSIKMFEKIQFMEISRSKIFKEITMELLVSDAWINWLNQNIKLNIVNYK